MAGSSKKWMENEEIEREARAIGRSATPSKDELLAEIERWLEYEKRPAHYQGTIDKIHLARIYNGLRFEDMAEEMAQSSFYTKDLLLFKIEQVLGLDRRPSHYQGTIDKIHLARICLALRRRAAERDQSKER